MDELTAIRAIGAQFDPPSDTPPRQLHDRVMMATATGAPVTGRGRRLRGQVAALTGLAAAITAALVMIQVVGVGNRAPTSSADANEILLQAARFATAAPAEVPRADQFLYVETATKYIEYPGVQRRYAWLSIGDTRDGLVKQQEPGVAGWDVFPLPGCRAGRRAEYKGPRVLGYDACRPSLGAYLTGLPTEPDAMLRYLYQDHPGDDRPPVTRAFARAGELTRETYLPPAVLATIFQALARVSGLTLVRGVTDAAGRPADAVGYTDTKDGFRSELLFDPETHELVGERSITLRPRNSWRAGAVTVSWVLLRKVIVQRIGQTG